MTARFLLLAFAAWLAALPTARADLAPPTRYGGPVAAPHVAVSLIGERARPAAIAGQPLTLGVRFALEEHWHVYWQNPGDSGEAPRLQWTLPAGWTAGAVQWPAPTRIATGPLINYGYEGDVILPVTLTPPTDAEGPATVALELTWLVCREDCIPGEQVFEFEVAVRPPDAAPAPTDAMWGPRFAGLREARPKPTPARFARDGEGLLRLYLPELTAPAGAAVHILAAEEGVVPPTAPVAVSRPAEGGLVLSVAPADTAPDPLEALTGLIQLDGDPRSSRAFEAEPGPMPAAAPPAAAAPLPPEEQTSMGLAVVFALLGGLLLNLMPCVFPVLSLKILAFVEHAADEHGVIRRQGWLFTAGVLASFWALAGALIALRAGGEQLGWGFQLQSPGFVAALAVLMFGLALSLAGVFEVGLSLTAVGGRGEWGAFGTGVLATVVATPCTAPFMGPALGFALTRPPVESLAVFTALGGGMALPYLVLSYAPGLLRRLPRPGPWMTTFKQLMAFPLFATVLWLVNVFLQQTGVAAAGALLTALLALAFAGWLWGRLQHSGRTGPAWLLVVLLAAAPGAWLAHGAVTFDDGADDDLWQPWTAEAQARLVAEGSPVFVNFTAAWCISCKVNERVVFDRDDVRAAFARHRVVTLLADWTDRDDEIGRTLENYGRQGVPLYLYHAPGAARPTVLPSVLTPDMLIATLDGATEE